MIVPDIASRPGAPLSFIANHRAMACAGMRLRCSTRLPLLRI